MWVSQSLQNVQSWEITMAFAAMPGVVVKGHANMHTSYVNTKSFSLPSPTTYIKANMLFLPSPY